MKFRCLATDYDGTIAQHGDVAGSTYLALDEFKASGRTLVLVTGRELHDLFKVCARPEIFDRIVAENGALVYCPETMQTRPLAPAPPQEFVELLRARGVTQLSIGRVIVATQQTYAGVVQSAIDELGLPLQIILNKGALMILPWSANKAIGLLAALEELRIRPAEVVGVGDAENDQVLLKVCGFSVAVANAIASLKKQANWVTEGRNGAGVEELVHRVLQDDLVSAAPQSRLPLTAAVGQSGTFPQRLLL